MEGSESEAVFEAFNLNPQHFINEALDAVNQMVEGAFKFCLEEASQITGGGADRSEEMVRKISKMTIHAINPLKILKGISYLHHLTREVVDKKMSLWETYCLRHCFSIPDGFVLPNSNESFPSVLETGLSDGDLNCQLDSLREKLTAVGKESEELRREISLLEKQSTVKNNYNASVAEVQQLFEEHSVLKMLQELAESTAKLHQKVAELKMKRPEVMKLDRQGKMHSFSEKEMLTEEVLSARLEDIQEVVRILRKA